MWYENVRGGLPMKILIAEDDLASSLFMKKYLSIYGNCDVVRNGIDAIESVMHAVKIEDPYDLICIDIMMPKVDGLKVLKSVREIERISYKKQHTGAKIIMTTALNDKETVEQANAYGCDAYVWKPIEVDNFDEVLKKLGLIE